MELKRQQINVRRVANHEQRDVLLVAGHNPGVMFRSTLPFSRAGRRTRRSCRRRAVPELRNHTSKATAAHDYSLTLSVPFGSSTEANA
jgi:hypothetical protein